MFYGFTHNLDYTQISLSSIYHWLSELLRIYHLRYYELLDLSCDNLHKTKLVLTILKYSSFV